MHKEAPVRAKLPNNMYTHHGMVIPKKNYLLFDTTSSDPISCTRVLFVLFFLLILLTMTGFLRSTQILTNN